MTAVESRVPDSLEVDRQVSTAVGYSAEPSDVSHDVDLVHSSDVPNGVGEAEQVSITAQTSEATQGLAVVSSQLLPQHVISDCCNIWFRKYHRWFPILHQPTASVEIETASPFDSDNGTTLVQQAIVATTLEESQSTWSIEAKRKWKARTTASITIAALDNATLTSIQALLVLSVMHYGDGDMLKSSSLLALCRRRASHQNCLGMPVYANSMTPD
jgi:hypothetical protein